jgi:ATP synthase I chain
MSAADLTPKTMKTTSWIILAVLVVAGWLWQGLDFAGGILVGGLVVIINFYWMAHILNSTLNRQWATREQFQTAGRQAAAFMVMKYIFRFTALAVIIFVLVKTGWVNIFGFLVGLSTVVLTLVVLGIIESRKIFFCRISEELFKEALTVHGTSNSLP